MSELKFLIGCQPAFSRWKFAHRSRSSSGESFIRSSRVSPSLSNAARAFKRRQWKLQLLDNRPGSLSCYMLKYTVYSKWPCNSAPYLHFCWARYQQTVQSWWSATGGQAPDVVSPPSGLRHQCLPHGSQWQKQSSTPGSDSPVRYKASRSLSRK